MLRIDKALRIRNLPPYLFAKIDEIKARAMGIEALIMKPIVMRDLAVTTRKVLDTRKKA